MSRYEWLVVVVVAGCKLSASGALLGGTTNGTNTTSSTGAADPGTVTMPNLFLMTRAEAEAAVRRAGIEREVSLDSSNAACGSTVDGHIVELGRVCYQSPAAGQTASRRGLVSIRVQHESPWRGDLGNGRFWFLMPDFVGWPVEKAKAKVRELGFVSKEVKIAYVDEPGCRPEVVCKTFPEGMTRTDNTSDKLFYVGRAVGEAPKPADAKPQPKPSLGDNF